MITLNTTLRKLQVVLSGAITTNQLPVIVHYQDYRTQDGATSFGSYQVNTNNTTAVDILAAPTSGTLRTVKEITIQNADSATATVTVRYNDNGTTYTILKVALTTGDNLIYQSGD